MKPTTVAFGEDTLTNWANQPGLLVTCVLTFLDCLCGVGRVRAYQRGAGQNIKRPTLGPLSNSISLHWKKRKAVKPWLVWLNGLSACLQTKRSLVRFPVRAHSWVVDQVPSWECAGGNWLMMFLSHINVFLPLPLHSPLSLKIKSLKKKEGNSCVQKALC